MYIVWAIQKNSFPSKIGDLSNIAYAVRQIYFEYDIVIIGADIQFIKIF